MQDEDHGHGTAAATEITATEQRLRTEITAVEQRMRTHFDVVS